MSSFLGLVRAVLAFMLYFYIITPLITRYSFIYQAMHGIYESIPDVLCNSEATWMTI